jgi:nucleoside-diphosphate kinase
LFPATLRGDYSMSMRENILHASDSPETAVVEIQRFFNDNELFDYDMNLISTLYADNEL